MQKLIIIITAFVFSCHTAVNAEPVTDDYFQNVEHNNSILAGIVTDLEIDSSGFLWIGTQHGLLRYDGHSFRHYTNEPDEVNSLAGNYVRDIYAAASGQIWIGSNSKGISVYRPETDNFLTFHKLSSQHTGSFQVFSMVENHNHLMFIGTSNGLYQFDSAAQSFEQVLLARENRNYNSTLQITALEVDDTNNLWVGTNEGLFVLPKNKQQMIKAKDFGLDNFTLFDAHIASLKIAGQRKLWIGSRNEGFGFVDLVSRNATHLLAKASVESFGASSSIEQVSENELWVSVTGDGFYRINLTTSKIIGKAGRKPAQTGSLNSNLINVIKKDPSGVIWIGHWGSGLNKFVPNNAIQTKYLDADLSSALYARSALQISEDSLYVGTNNGLRTYNLLTGQLKAFIPSIDSPINLNNRFIYSIFQPNKENLWLGSRDAIYELNLTNKKLSKLPVEVSYGLQFLAKDRDNVWILDNNQLILLNKNDHSAQTINYKNEHGEIENIGQHFVMLKDMQQRVWVGSSNGLFLLRKDASEFTKVNGAVNDVIALAISNNTLWFSALTGLYALALDRFEDGDVFVDKAPINFTRANDTVFANLQFDKLGRLWEATVMYDPRTQQTFEFGIADGIDLGADWIGSSAKLDDGRLIFGGSKGLLFLNPERVLPWSYIPPIRLTDLQIDGLSQPIQQNHKAIISSEVQSVSIEFAALDYSEPEKLNYQYQLGGFDREWQTSNPKQRFVTYTNLSPGDYNLKVKATNRVGTWTPETQLVSFQVLPAFYQTWWFRFIGLVVLLTLIYLFIVWRVRKISEAERERNEVQLVKERAQMMEDVIEQKNQLLADVSHELRTPLTALHLKVEELQHNLVEDVDESYERMIDKISDINRMISDIYQLAQADIGALSLYEDSYDVCELMADWTDEFKELVEHKDYAWQCNNQLPDSIYVTFDKDRIKQVIANLLSNSLSYTDAPGTIALAIRKQNDQLVISISDSAPGVSEQDLTRIFERMYRVEASRSRATGGSGLGLSICKSIIEAHQGEIAARPSDLGGVCITIKLPLNNEDQDNGSYSHRRRRF